MTVDFEALAVLQESSSVFATVSALVAVIGAVASFGFFAAGSARRSIAPLALLVLGTLGSVTGLAAGNPIPLLVSLAAAGVGLVAGTLIDELRTRM